jgi:uncharacterized SAM-binding protein YcdF (DUF218 family)
VALKWRRRIPALLAAVILCWGVTLAYRISREAAGDPLQPADAIVVFGAAEYAGHPSPVLRSRLDHALELWQQHYAPVIITTGGMAADPKFSEGGVGSRYLTVHGVPEDAVVAETQASDTAQSARRVAAIMHENDMTTCIAVSDGYHLFRIKRMMAREGIIARGAPRREKHNVSLPKRVATDLKEAVSYTAWLLHLT